MLNFKKYNIIISFLAILLVLFGGFGNIEALASDSFLVEFENTPLFSEANFLPESSVTRWIKVNNNSGEEKEIITEAINVSDSDNFGDLLNIKIKEDEDTLYTGTLSEFFSAGEVYLSSLNGSTQYDFVVTFNPTDDNESQGKSLGFDILIGIQGEEGGSGGGGGGGGGLPPGLTILDESLKITNITETTATVLWTTSYFSTSQVIYSAEGESRTLDLSDNSGTPPKYGYVNTTPEYDIGTKVTGHSVTMTGLIPGTTYYIRSVSHGSLAISKQYSFTAGQGSGELNLPKPEDEKFPDEEEVILPIEQEGEKGEEGGEGGKAGSGEEGVIKKEITEEESVEKEPSSEKEGINGLLAAIGNSLFNLRLFLILFGLIIFILWLLGRKKRDEDEEEEKKKPEQY